MALIDKLTNIAEAIRGKTGGTELLTLDEMATAISSITGAGGVDIHTETLITFAQDMKYVEMINTAQYRFRYKNSIVFLIATGSTAASSGNYTMNNFCIAHSGVNSIFAFDQYIVGNVAPDKFKNFAGVVERFGSFYISEEGVLGTTSTSTSSAGGPGTVVRAIEIPISIEQWENWTVDDTLWGEK